MTQWIQEIVASRKVRIPVERLQQMLGVDKASVETSAAIQVTAETLVPNLLVEVSDVKELEGTIGADQISAQGITILPDVFPNPIVKGSFAVGQLLRLVDLECVLSVEEDVEVHVEDSVDQESETEGERNGLH